MNGAALGLPKSVMWQNITTNTHDKSQSKTSGFRADDPRKWWTDGRRRADGRTDAGSSLDWYTISSPCEPNEEVKIFLHFI